jgi:hypothetical protein
LPTIKEPPLEETHPNHSEDYKEEYHYKHHGEYAWQGTHDGLQTHSQPVGAAHKPQHPYDSEHFNHLQTVDEWVDRGERDEQNEEVEEIPRVSQIALLSIKYKAIGDELHYEFAQENHSGRKIHPVECLYFVTVRVACWFGE